MGQRLQPIRNWRSGDGHRVWLSMLVDAMEEVSRPESRRLPCDPAVLVALGAQLARPAAPCRGGGSNFSRLN